MDRDEIATPPIQRLLFFISQDTSEEMLTRLREFVIGLATYRNWLIRPPYLVDLNGADGSCAQDAGVLEIYSAISPTKLSKDIDATHLDEVRALVEKIEEFSRENSLEFELEIDGKFVGAIDSGEADRSLRVGLLGEWQKQLAK